ncbi:PriCT-2 domain-containing protein [Paenibacillus sp. ACRRX]|uniref:PriCT-2 domain-containing protein n=1 Tax=Paenibacillus sp. ACRRX TaxID=2918206 RepID=UPI001EF6CBA7|nr:PriCT-2 domain-containing protein [Paenibacillus sp. ACRRX]MCG7406822.1 PriCT-2 domain-containing protein [Paenibacillus sp. ACRRX]
MEHKLDLIALLGYVDSTYLDYQEWVNVGMALKYEVYTASDWDDWSKRDGSRYHPGECFKKWSTFEGSGIPVTGATITQMAKDNDWMPRSRSKSPVRKLKQLGLFYITKEDRIRTVNQCDWKTALLL